MTAQGVFAQQFHFKNITSVPDASFRGLSVIDDRVAWVSGSDGWFSTTTDGGNHWNFRKVKGFEQVDFRSLYAFDAQSAIIANADAPAYILRTDDGGQIWKVVYKNEDTAAFFDGIDFWNNHDGIIYGDPIKGIMTILRTEDGGLTWRELPQLKRPHLAQEEASFAASGTNIRCLNNNSLIIATGGKVSRLWTSHNRGADWQQVKTPIIQGKNTTGVFSVAFQNETTGIIVGGDYKLDSLKTNNAFYTKNGGKDWLTPSATTGGYRECVEFIDHKTAIATGPGGTDISRDKGETWQPLPDEKGFHVIRKSRKGSLIILAGKGRIFIASK